MGVMETRASRTRRDAEDLGDLGRGVALVVVEHEQCPLFGREPPEPAFELVPVGDREQVIGRGRSVDRQHSQVRGSAPLARRLVDAFTDDDTVDPRVEPVRIAEASQVTPGDHQRLLKGILGSVDIAQDPVRQHEESVDPRAHQVDECRLIAVLGRFHEVAVHIPIPRAPVGDAVRHHWPVPLSLRSIFNPPWPVGYPRAGRVPAAGGVEGSRMYQWLVFAHLVGLVIFALCHGVSVFVAFRVRRIDDPAVAAGYLQLSQSANQAMYVGLLLLAIGGIGAASEGNRWGETWVWASVVVLIAVIVLMYVIGASYYYRLRDTLAGKGGVEPLTSEQLVERLATRRPEWLVAVGGVGLLVLIWLMVLKPT
jgi:hypothetical protein